MTQITFIWDFDGTLADSYIAIGEALEALYAHYQLVYEAEMVRDYIIETSVGQLLQELAEQHQLPLAELQAFFKAQHESRDDTITLIPYAKETLELTSQLGIQHFVYTHKGRTTQVVLERLGIAHYFTEVVTSVNGFQRKPHPEGVLYLMDKYHLTREKTYYIGDRLLDLEVAVASGIGSINLGQPTSEANIGIESLAEIVPLFAPEKP